VYVAPGEIIGDRYRVENVLGEGGMAIVFKAIHLKTEQRRALKIIRPEIARKYPQFIDRFLDRAHRGVAVHRSRR
jgi:serine/threonine-protein kinase